MFSARNRDNKNFNFKVRQNIALKALIWFHKHDALYKNLVINIKHINQVPENEYLNVCSTSIKERNKSFEAYDCGALEDKENDSFIESSSFLCTHTNFQPKEPDRLKDALETNRTIEIDKNLLSE